MTVLLGLTLVTLTVYGAYRLTRLVCGETPAGLPRATLQGPPRIEYARPDDGVDWETNDQAFAWIVHKYKRSSIPEPWTGRTARDKNP